MLAEEPPKWSSLRWLKKVAKMGVNRTLSLQVAEGCSEPCFGVGRDRLSGCRVGCPSLDGKRL